MLRKKLSNPANLCHVCGKPGLNGGVISCEGCSRYVHKECFPPQVQQIIDKEDKHDGMHVFCGVCNWNWVEDFLSLGGSDHRFLSLHFRSMCHLAEIVTNPADTTSLGDGIRSVGPHASYFAWHGYMMHVCSMSPCQPWMVTSVACL